MIGYAIDARRQRFPDETPYTYRPHADSGESLPLDPRRHGRPQGLQPPRPQHLTSNLPFPNLNP